MKRSKGTNGPYAEAAECFQCLIDPRADPRTRARWVAWLGASPDNRAAYEAVERIWRRPVPDDLWPTPGELASDTHDADTPVTEHVARRRRMGQGPWHRLLAHPAIAVSALALVAAIGGGIMWLAFGQNEGAAPIAYATARGEERQVSLPDGSEVVLGPLSELDFVVSSASRTATLVRGQAMFTVAHDPVRAFAVVAGQGEVRDIGTIFGVAVRPDGIVVTVVDGIVSVSTRDPGQPAGAGVTVRRDQQVTYQHKVGSIVDVDAGRATAWSHGELAYVDRPLGEVAADLTRYSQTDVIVADPNVSALRYTGTIGLGAIDQWIAGLSKVYPVRVGRSGSRLILYYAPKS